MSAHDIQLGEVVDSDRFKIIDLYKQCPVLWCKEGAGRDKTLAAWNFIAENVSTTERVFTIPLIQKIVKNLRDQYVRLQRRGIEKTAWKFVSYLDFLTIPSSSKKSRRLDVSRWPKHSRSPISFVKVESEPFQLDSSFNELANSVKLSPEDEKKDPMCRDQNSMKSYSPQPTKSPPITRTDPENRDIGLGDVNDTDRLKIIELYKERPILWAKRRNGTRDEIAEAWSFIRDGVSTPERQFSTQLVQKLTKNLKDQYVRLKRRGIETTTWRYFKPLSFLGSNNLGSKNAAGTENLFRADKGIRSIKKQTVKTLSDNTDPTTSLLSNTNPLLDNLPLLSLAIPLLSANQQQSSPPIPTSLSSESLSVARNDLLQGFKEVAAWSMLVKSYMMNSGRPS